MVAEHTTTNGLSAQYLGLYPATVTALEGDPEDLHRIAVSFDWLRTTADDAAPTGWATVITPYADAEQGIQMLPEIGSTVVVGFLAGYLDQPYVVGAVWNGTTEPPVPFEDINNLRVIQSRSGSRLEFDDTEGAVAVKWSAAGDAGSGGHSIVMDDAGQNITVTSKSGASIELTAAGGVTITAAATVEISAAMLTVNAAMSDFSGIVTCDTLIAKGGGVVSPMYTPGAGNIW